MTNSAKATVRFQPSFYHICIRGVIAPNWSDWLNGMEILTQQDKEGFPTTTLIGPVTDQAALRGILCRIWDLNLTVLSVTRVDSVVYNRKMSG